MGVEEDPSGGETFDQNALTVDVLNRSDAFIDSTVESLLAEVGDENILHAALAAVNSESLRRRTISRQSVAGARVAYELLMAIRARFTPTDIHSD